MALLNGLFVLDADALDWTYSLPQRAAIDRHVRQVAPPLTAAELAHRPQLLVDVDVLISGWGAPVVDDAFLDAAPNLRAIFYGAGAVGTWATDALWQRGIVVTTASAANARPVAEYTLGMILLGLKRAWPLSKTVHDRLGAYVTQYIPGSYRRTVGLISFGVIARALRELLRSFDLDVIVHDPFLSEAEANLAGVRRAALGEIFEQADVVSLHAPLLPETVGLVTGRHLASMKRGGLFINTARGAIVRQDELIAVAGQRPDLQFVLDTVTPEPLPKDSPLTKLANVWMTPHLAGSVGKECQRMGQFMVDEIERYATGRPLQWAVSRAASAFSSHRPTRRTAPPVPAASV